MVRATPGGNGQTDPAFAYLGGLGCEAQMDTNMWEYIDTIENRRVEIADPVTGLVWGMSHFHHDMKEERYRLIGVPGTEYRTIRASTGAGFDMPAIHIYKVWGGQMHEIEAIGHRHAVHVADRVGGVGPILPVRGAHAGGGSAQPLTEGPLSATACHHRLSARRYSLAHPAAQGREDLVQTSSFVSIGRLRTRLPVSLNSALVSAGITGGSAGSPMPVGRVVRLDELDLDLRRHRHARQLVFVEVRLAWRRRSRSRPPARPPGRARR